MQQNAMKQARRDVKITLRDSAQMKAIAILTMIFLPSTALAVRLSCLQCFIGLVSTDGHKTIFSMSSFFEVDDDGNLKVLPNFWVFWAISVPITLGVLSSYYLWIRHIDRKRR